MTISSQTTFEELQLLSILYPEVSWEFPTFIDVGKLKIIKKLYACLDNPYKNLSSAFNWHRGAMQEFSYWMDQSRLERLEGRAEAQIKIWIWMLENGQN